MIPAYYNEIDLFCCEWLENLQRSGHISRGGIDPTSITDADNASIIASKWCHFFAGVGGWDLALQMAGWPADVPVWTGSCPCQPFSVAGKRKGFDDDKHLWPAWFAHIRKYRPAVIFGEQVSGGDGLQWFDAVSADLEAEGYAVGAADLCAAGVGAPHIRQRLYWVAYAPGERFDRERLRLQSRQPRQSGLETGGGGSIGVGLGDANSLHSGRNPGAGTGAEAGMREPSRGFGDGARAPSAAGDGLGDPDRPRLARRQGEQGDHGSQLAATERASGFWSDPDWVECRDGRQRPTERGTFPVAYGISGRLERRRANAQLKGYGNAIVPQVAAQFIQAFMEVV